MKIKKHSKLIIAVIIIFISGLIIGGGSGYTVAKIQDQQADPLLKFKTDILRTVAKELKLTPEQQVKFILLLDKGMKRMKQFRLKHTPEILMIVKENHQDLKEILTPEQWDIYDGFRSKTLKKMQKNIPKI